MEPKPLDWLPPDGRAQRLRTMLAGLLVGAVIVVAAWPMIWLAFGFEGLALGLTASALSFLALTGGGLGALFGYMLRLDAQRCGRSRLWSLRGAVILGAGLLGMVLGGAGGAASAVALCDSCELEVFEWMGVGLFLGAVTGAGLGVVLARMVVRFLSHGHG